jgi:hypothetical protein
MEANNKVKVMLTAYTITSFFLTDKEGEKWVKCTKCLQWSHEMCVEEKWEYFMYVFCSDG